MRLPLLWLHDYCDPGLVAAELATRLALTGTEVDRVHAHGVTALEHFRVGRVLQAEQHPDADRLRVCIVDVGEGEPHQIVCGAPNVAAGQTVAVASPGAVMPGGLKLKKAKLRGQESNGMILSERELELSEEHDGIAVLATDAPPGTPWQDDPPPPGDGVAGFSVEVRSPDLCPRFTARLFEDVTLGPSPYWLKARLMAAGQRPINNVVDITNYVMLLTGQPMHAFDADLVAGGTLVVRRARDGETMTTLDDVERTLDAEMCVIDDADGPTSIAGVMGGARSEVHAGTTRVLMEAATWNGPNIQRTSTRLALRTEASGRFEKQLQPEQGLEGQAVATKLMIELCGARPAGGTIDVGGPGPEPRTLRLRDARTERLLGTAVPRADAARILTALGFEVRDAEDGLDVTVPVWRRGDVEREADLVEEVARLWGLDRLPVTLPSRRGAVGRLAPPQRLRRRLEDALLGAGLTEAVGWSFTARETAEKLGLPDEGAVELENPMSEEQAVMRTTLLGSLLDSLKRNASRGMEDVRLFEVGAVYHAGAASGPTGNPWYPEPDPALPAEGTHVGALLTGRLRPASWNEPEPPRAGFFAAKGVLEALLQALRLPFRVSP